MKSLFSTVAVLIAAALGLAACTAHRQPYNDQSGWTTLIDGTRASLDNWTTVGDANWRFEYGNVVADAKGKNNGFLVSKNTYTDFHLRVEFWVSPGSDSGIIIRNIDPKKVGPSSTGYHVNIYDTRPDPRYGTGAIIDVAAVNPMPKVDGRWSTIEITAKGDRLTVWVNGTLTADVIDNKFKSGRVALQYVTGVVKWRKVQIRPIV